ncbi:MAG: AAA family ATPase, partial [Saprospiraceae bacterium]|nr:AAA family ATPase [Saprospiraceae bacterium]
MPNARFPYGVSNFDTMVSEGYYYLDRTAHIETLERMNSRFNFFLRPRRFGKSLFVSALQYYYGKEHKADFERLFGNYYIGQNPTPRANGYLVLKFDFSGIETDTIETTYRHFLANIQDGIVGMMRTYSDVFGKQEISAVLAADSPALAAQALMAAMKDKAEKIFLIIDEYDHFTNEIIAFNFNNFREIVSQNGFVRKFYEVLKKGTQTGVIDRMFVTGVSPVTLDSLTSGFNIGANLSLDLDLHDLMGFTEAETAGILRAADVPDDQLDTVRTDLRAWYNGYRFNREAVNRLYNPDMVLYFAMHYARYGKYPDRLLDPNVSSDYGKIRRMFRVGNEGENLAILEQIVRDGAVQAAITAQFSFEKRWT